MSKLKKFLLRSASLTMLIKGITSVHAIPTFEEVSIDRLETTKRQLQHPS